MGNDLDKTTTDAPARRQSPAAAAFARLSQREKVLIYALIVIGACVALVMLLILPTLDNIRTLEEEALQAETTKQEYVQAIAEGAGADQAIEEAQAAYEASQEKLFAPMSPEELDTTVTGYLVKAGFDPSTLTLSLLAPEQVTPYAPLPISDTQLPENPAVQASAAEEGTSGGTAMDTAAGDAATTVDATATAGEPATTAGDTATAEESATAGEEIPIDMTGTETAAVGGLIRSYTVSITAEGGWNNLYKLLSRIKATDGAAITQYSYTESVDPDKADGGSFSMTIKLYVFVESAA
jgi:cell division protein FtsL